ncbi:imidazole glycerol phosphate synthase subunit HisH [Leptospira ilyithenensis]|uniref:Imidazole glycerol phosphate synthase subunit HisH n=1 Tax=Leptospira ilyithenensis TaxID=2484901 RepID=A0A4R9LKE3_9LEPT|nr:imidazole glycerol phosphate synthase subunit HisH [Leptospira ilyithenensis]TGN08002.1 imidazole glycerol phosphate synthase subunit HisH [Leptospira ilyithenensis]
MLVGIVNYGAGNLYSIMGALEYLKIPYELVSSQERLSSCSHIILPGVGSFRKAMEKLHELNFYDPIIHCTRELNIPILGICLGMQLLCTSSDEDGFTKGLNLIGGHFALFDSSRRKVPHVGFDSAVPDSGSVLFKEIAEEVDFYFVHSYRLLETDSDTKYAYSVHDGERFISAFEKKNIFGTQFHPELSQGNGLKLLGNFVQLTTVNG